MKKYYRNLKHGFIIESTGTVGIVFNEDWVRIEDGPVISLIGKVVFPANSIRELDYYSDGWIIECFEECSKYNVEIDKENEMWIVTDLSDLKRENLYGGYYHEDSNLVLEWDCDEPADMAEIHKEIEKHIPNESN